MQRFEESVIRIAAAMVANDHVDMDYISRTSFKLAEKLEDQFQARERQRTYAGTGSNGELPALLRRQAE